MSRKTRMHHSLRRTNLGSFPCVCVHACGHSGCCPRALLRRNGCTMWFDVQHWNSDLDCPGVRRLFVQATCSEPSSLTFQLTTPWGSSTANVSVPLLGLSNPTISLGKDVVWKNGQFSPTAGVAAATYVLAVASRVRGRSFVATLLLTFNLWCLACWHVHGSVGGWSQILCNIQLGHSPCDGRLRGFPDRLFQDVWTSQPRSDCQFHSIVLGDCLSDGNGGDQHPCGHLPQPWFRCRPYQLPGPSKLRPRCCQGHR